MNNMKSGANSKELKSLSKYSHLLSEEEHAVYGPLFEKSISKDIQDNATNVKNIRNKYLHYLSHEYDHIETDSKKAFVSSIKLVKSLFDFPIEDGRLRVPPYLDRYLSKK